jgi:hypothetical protein
MDRLEPTKLSAQPRRAQRLPPRITSPEGGSIFRLVAECITGLSYHVGEVEGSKVWKELLTVSVAKPLNIEAPLHSIGQATLLL